MKKFANAIHFDETKREMKISFENEKEKFCFLVDDYEEFKNIPNEDFKYATIGFFGSAICIENHDLHVLIEGLGSIENNK